MPKELIPLLPVIIAVLIVLRRSGRTQRVRASWTVPILSAIAVVSTLYQEPVPSAVAIALFVTALILGLGVGYYRALHIELSTDPATGQVMSKTTPFGTFLVVGFILLRFGMAYFMKGDVHQAAMTAVPSPPDFHAAARHGVDLFRLADAGLIFSTAMTIAQRVEVLRRAQPLFAAAKKAVAGPES